MCRVPSKNIGAVLIVGMQPENRLAHTCTSLSGHHWPLDPSGMPKLWLQRFSGFGRKESSLKVFSTDGVSKYFST